MIQPLPGDDADWIEILRGRNAPGADPRTREEAQRIRAALREQERANAGETATGLDALLFRLRREGLLAGAPVRSWLRPAYALAAVLAVTAIALPLVMTLEREQAVPEAPPQTRGLPPRPAILVSDAPGRTAAALAAALREAGASVEASEMGEGIRLVATVPEGRRAPVAEALARFGVANPPAGAVVRIHVVSRRDAP